MLELEELGGFSLAPKVGTVLAEVQTRLPLIPGLRTAVMFNGSSKLLCNPLFRLPLDGGGL